MIASSPPQEREESRKRSGSERAVRLFDSGNHSEAADAFVDYALVLSGSGDVVGVERSLIEAAEKLDTVQYYRVAGDMRKTRLTDAIEELRNMKLGNLVDIKKDLVEAFMSMLEK